MGLKSASVHSSASSASWASGLAHALWCVGVQLVHFTVIECKSLVVSLNHFVVWVCVCSHPRRGGLLTASRHGHKGQC